MVQTSCRARSWLYSKTPLGLCSCQVMVFLLILLQRTCGSIYPLLMEKTGKPIGPTVGGENNFLSGTTEGVGAKTPAL